VSQRPLPRPVSGDVAYEQIRQAIVEGRYRPGQRLIEQRIGEEFSFSRTPVREALRRLEAEGLLTSEPNRGARVRQLTSDDIADLYELRARLEALAAELAAERADEDEVAALSDAVAAFEAAIPPDGVPDVECIRRLSGANQAFHAGVMDAAHHAHLARMVERTIDSPLVFEAFRQFEPGEFERSALFHGMIRDAIAAREPKRAGRLMTEHILQGRDLLLSKLEHGDTAEALLDAAASASDGLSGR
jgi:DNA-binding GntR family transcriptional regulator